MAQQNASAIDSQVIHVTMDGAEAAAITTAIATYLMLAELAESDPVLRGLCNSEDISALKQWIEKVSPLIEMMAEEQRQAAKDDLKGIGYL